MDSVLIQEHIHDLPGNSTTNIWEKNANESNCKTSSNSLADSLQESSTICSVYLQKFFLLFKFVLKLL